MTYQHEREEFLTNFGREFPEAPQHVALLLLRYATASQRYNESACSIDIGEKRQAKADKVEARRLEQVAERCREIGAVYIEGGDPRGFPFLLGCPSGRTYDFGGRGLGVPGRGLPASAFGG